MVADDAALLGVDGDIGSCGAGGSGLQGVPLQPLVQRCSTAVEPLDCGWDLAGGAVECRRERPLLRGGQHELGAVREDPLRSLATALHQELRQRFVAGRCGAAEQLVVAGRDAEVNGLGLSLHAELILFPDSNDGSHFQIKEPFIEYVTSFIDR